MPKQAASVTKILADLANLTCKSGGGASGSTYADALKISDDSSASASAPQAPLRIHFPTAVVSEPGVRLTKEVSAPTPTFAVSATALNNVTLPNCDLSPVSSVSSSASGPLAGPAFKPEHEEQATSIDDLSSSTAKDLNNNVPKYLVVALDLDPPFPSFPFMAPILHGVQADLSLATEKLDPDDEYIQLEPETVSNITPVVDYMGPAPPPPSSPHRYVFMLWEQPAGLTAAKIRSKLGFPELAVDVGGEEAESDGVGFIKRLRWDQEDFERKLGLGEVVAGNYFVC